MTAAGRGFGARIIQHRILDADEELLLGVGLVRRTIESSCPGEGPEPAAVVDRDRRRSRDGAHLEGPTGRERVQDFGRDAVAEG